MEKNKLANNIDIVKEVLRNYLHNKGLRNTPERYAILEEIYQMNEHFNVDDLYLFMIQKKYQVSKATIYNSIEVFIDAKLIRKHQFSEKTSTMATYEKSYFDKQHDHIIIYKDEDEKEISEIIEFCDPRIQVMKASLEEVFGIKIKAHTLYFYGHKNTENPE